MAASGSQSVSSNASRAFFSSKPIACTQHKRRRQALPAAHPLVRPASYTQSSSTLAHTTHEFFERRAETPILLVAAPP